MQNDVKPLKPHKRWQSKGIYTNADFQEDNTTITSSACGCKNCWWKSTFSWRCGGFVWQPAPLWDLNSSATQASIIIHCTMTSAALDAPPQSGVEDCSHSFQVGKTCLTSCVWWSRLENRSFSMDEALLVLFPGAFLSADKCWHERLNSEQMAQETQARQERTQQLQQWRETSKLSWICSAENQEVYHNCLIHRGWVSGSNWDQRQNTSQDTSWTTPGREDEGRSTQTRHRVNPNP